MAAITITVPAGAATARVVTAICTAYGYQATINGSPNPQTQAEFVKQWIITQVKNAVTQYEANTAAAAAAATSTADVNTNIVIS